MGISNSSPLTNALFPPKTLLLILIQKNQNFHLPAMHKNIIIFTLMLLVSLSIFSQQQYLYKQVDTVDLYLETRFPENIDPEKDYPAIIFFFGGG